MAAQCNGVMLSLSRSSAVALPDSMRARTVSRSPRCDERNILTWMGCRDYQPGYNHYHPLATCGQPVLLTSSEPGAAEGTEVGWLRAPSALTLEISAKATPLVGSGSGISRRCTQCENDHVPVRFGALLLQLVAVSSVRGSIQNFGVRPTFRRVPERPTFSPEVVGVG
jgi:hypothetical protein